MRQLTAWACMVLAGLISQGAHAAWPQPKNELLIISALSDYRAKARFDAFGARTRAARYTKQELSFYSAYGLTGSLTLGAQPVFVRLRAGTSFGGAGEKINALSHIEIFARQRVLAGEDWVMSMQVLAKFPHAGAVEREPMLEASNRDLEGRLLYGQSGSTGKYFFNLEYFSSFEAGVRIRDRGAANQWRSDAALGLRLRPDYQVILQSFNTIALQGGGDLDSSAYDLYKAQGSLLHTMKGGVAVQVGGFSEYSGRNISAGRGLFMAIWSRF